MRSRITPPLPHLRALSGDKRKKVAIQLLSVPAFKRIIGFYYRKKRPLLPGKNRLILRSKDAIIQKTVQTVVRIIESSAYEVRA